MADDDMYGAGVDSGNQSSPVTGSDTGLTATDSTGTGGFAPPKDITSFSADGRSVTDDLGRTWTYDDGAYRWFHTDAQGVQHDLPNVWSPGGNTESDIQKGSQAGKGAVTEQGDNTPGAPSATGGQASSPDTQPAAPATQRPLEVASTGSTMEAKPDFSPASFLEDIWFYNRDISAGYKAYSAAMESLWIEDEMRAYGLIPSPTDQTPSPAQNPVASAPPSTPAQGSSSASAKGQQDPSQANQSETNAQPPADEDATRLGIIGQLATREGNNDLFDRMTKPALPQANGAANDPDDSYRAMAESIYPQIPFPAPGQIKEEKGFWEQVADANPFKASVAYAANSQPLPKTTQSNTQGAGVQTDAQGQRQTAVSEKPSASDGTNNAKSGGNLLYSNSPSDTKENASDQKQAEVKDPDGKYPKDKIPIELPDKYHSWMDFFRDVAKKAGDENLATYLAKVATKESGIGENPYNKKSTATGLMQYIDGTWFGTTDKEGKHIPGMVDKYGATLGITNDRAGKRDPYNQAVVTALEAKRNSDALSKILSDRKPTEYDLYLAHFLGLAGAAKFLKALEADIKFKTSTFADSILPNAAKNNKETFYKTLYKDENGEIQGKDPRTLQEVYELEKNKLDEKYNQPHYQTRLNQTKHP